MGKADTVVDLPKRPKFPDFTPAIAADTAPIGFRLYGEDFDCVVELAYLDMLDAQQAQDDGKAVLALTKFLAASLTPESRTRFDALSRNPETPVGVNTLAKIAEAVAEQYRDRLNGEA